MQGENITSAQAFFNNENKELLVKVALSSVSTDNALQNMATEGEGFPFDEIRDKAKLAWNEALESINVESDNKDLKTIFYTALYHTKVAPVTFSDANGDFRLENDSIVKKPIIQPILLSRCGIPSEQNTRCSRLQIQTRWQI